MYKLDLEKTEEPEIKLLTFIGSRKKTREFQKKSTSASMTMLKPLTVWITTNWTILRDGNIRPLYLPPGQETTVRNGHETKDWFKIGKGV